MVGRSREAASDATLASLQRAVSCVTRAVIVRGRYGPDAPHYWTFDERYVPLQGRFRLELSLLHTFTFRASADAPGDWRPTSTSYLYQLRERGGPEIVLFHWHPVPNLVQFPHLHVTAGAGSVTIDPRRHVPTGRVSLEAVIRFAIAELHVRPRRPDWQQVLTAGEREFDARRTW